MILNTLGVAFDSNLLKSVSLDSLAPLLETPFSPLFLKTIGDLKKGDVDG